MLLFFLRKPIGWLIDLIVLAAVVFFGWVFITTHSLNPLHPAQISYCGLTYKDAKVPQLDAKAARAAGGGALTVVKTIAPIGFKVYGHVPSARAAGEKSCASRIFFHNPGGDYRQYDAPSSK